MTCNNILTIKSTSIIVSGGSVFIIIPSVTLVNNQRFRLILCQNIPSNAGVGQVYVTMGNNVNIPLNTHITGNYVRADQLRCRRCYDMVYGTNPVHMNLLCPVKRSCFDIINGATIPVVTSALNDIEETKVTLKTTSKTTSKTAQETIEGA